MLNARNLLKDKTHNKCLQSVIYRRFASENAAETGVGNCLRPPVSPQSGKTGGLAQCWAGSLNFVISQSFRCLFE